MAKELTNAPEFCKVDDVDFSDESIEKLKSDIAQVEELKNTVATTIVRAKKNGLDDRAGECRTILQRLVIIEKKYKEDLDIREKAKLAAELDGLIETYRNNALACEGVIVEEKGNEYDHKAKARKLSILAKVVGYIGSIACVLGCIIYLILCQPEVLSVPFNWLWVAIDGAVLVLFLVLAFCIAGTARFHRNMAKIEEEERIKNEELEKKMVFSENTAAAEAAFAFEREREAQMDAEAAPVEEPEKKKLSIAAIREAIQRGEWKEKIANNKKVIIPVATAVTATVAASVALACKSSRKEKAPRAVTLHWDEE